MKKEGVVLFLLAFAVIAASAYGGADPTLEVRAWLYDTRNSADRSDDVIVDPEGSAFDYYVETGVVATQGVSSPARLYSGDRIWDVYSDGSAIYRLVFQFQADVADLKYKCDSEDKGYWFVQTSDGYWAYADSSGRKELLSREKTGNQDVSDTAGTGNTRDDYRVAQSFVAKGEVSSVQIFSRRRYATESSAIVRIETDNSGEPSGTLVSSTALDTVSSSSFSTSSGWVSFEFGSPIPLQPDTTYHIVVKDGSTMDNIPVCTLACTQYQPVMTSDGYNGAIVTWSDKRDLDSYDIWAQRYDSSGSAQWTANGVAVCARTSNQAYPGICSDDYHGAIIAWRDSRCATYDVYAQRIDSLGDSLWAYNGVPVCTTTNDQEDPLLVEDGYHGAIIVWWDTRNGTTYDLYAQRVDSAGNMVWTTNGVAICTAANDQMEPRLISDDYHGAIVVWHDERGADSDIYAQRVDSLGNVLWGANGVPVCTTSGTQEDPMLVTDGYHGALITWQDYRGADGDVYIQRADSLGNMNWTANGVQVTNVEGSQTDAWICSDGYKGAILTWEDTRGSGKHIYAQRVDSSGAMMWTANGVAVCTAAGNQEYPKMASDGYHGAIITWGDERSSTDHNIYARRVDSLGNVLWTNDGVAVTAAPDTQYRPEVLSDGNHGAWITWYKDYRSDNQEIYMDAVDSDGNVRFCGGGDYEWAYEAADYSGGEMLERSSGTASWTHYSTQDLFFKFPEDLVTSYESGWWSDPTDISGTYAPDIANDITNIDSDDRFECNDALTTRYWQTDAYSGKNTLYGDTDSTLMWELQFKVDEDWTDNDTACVQLHIDAGGNGNTTDILFKLHTTNVKLKWAYPAPDAAPITNGVVSSPVIRNGRVYVTCHDSTLYCLSATDGSLIWSYAANATINSSPSAVSESGELVIYFACDGGYVYAVKDTGDSYEEKWTQQVTPGQAIRGSPMVMDSLLYIGCQDDSVHCRRTSDGTRKWATFADGTSSSPSVYNDVVYIGTLSDTLYALDANDGTILRRKGLCGDIFAPSFLLWETGRLCIGSYASSTPGSDTLYVLESDNFDVYWKYADSGNLARTYTSCFALSDTAVYFGNDNNYVYCVDITDSTLTYKYDTGDVVRSSPVWWGPVYFGSNNDKFYCLDEGTQEPKADWPFYSDDNIESSPAISISSLIAVVGSNDGHVYAFDLEP